jgi:hypothetical protein
MPSSSAIVSLRDRLSGANLLGFRASTGSVARIGGAKVGNAGCQIENISTSFTLNPASAGSYVLFPSATVFNGNGDTFTFHLGISISGLPAGTSLMDPSTGVIGTLSSGTDTLSEDITGQDEVSGPTAGANLQASLEGLTLTFQPGAIIPASVNIMITFALGDAVTGLPNQQTTSQSVQGVADATLACFAAGTRIATSSGDVAVEFLRIGNEVVSVFGGVAPVKWLGHRRIDCTRHPRPMDVWPVRVCRNAFAEGLPRRDLILSPDHAVYVENHLIPIRYLLNGATILQERRDSVTYWHLELPAHDVIVAEGLPAETYLDTGNRNAFAECDGAVAMTPDFARAVWDAEGCAPLMTDGPIVRCVRETLWKRALDLGCARTNDPGLELWANGAKLATQATPDGVSANLPTGARWMELRSRRSVPLQERQGDDGRMLGTPVSAVRLDGETLPRESDRFGDGWHEREDHWRWTNGAAMLRIDGARTIEISLAELGLSYWTQSTRKLAAA